MVYQSFSCRCRYLRFTYYSLHGIHRIPLSRFQLTLLSIHREGQMGQKWLITQRSHKLRDSQNDPPRYLLSSVSATLHFSSDTQISEPNHEMIDPRRARARIHEHSNDLSSISTDSGWHSPNGTACELFGWRFTYFFRRLNSSPSEFALRISSLVL